MVSLGKEDNVGIEQSRLLADCLFGNPKVLKLGFGMKEDLQVLSRSFPDLQNLPKLITNWIDLRNLWPSIQTNYSSFNWVLPG